jgi:hypothetical protein
MLIAILQLHEYWTIDHVPDGQDATMETLERYEQRMGLTPKDRGIMPEFGYLGAIPLDAKVIRPTLEILGEEVQAELPLIAVSENEITATIPATMDQAAIAEVTHRMNEETPHEEEIQSSPVYELVDSILTDEELLQQLKAALGRGTETIKIKIAGKVFPVTGKKLDYVPKEFLKTGEEAHAQGITPVMCGDRIGVQPPSTKSPPEKPSTNIGSKFGMPTLM